MYKTIKLGKAECLGAFLAIAAAGTLLIGAAARAEAAATPEEGTRELPIIMYHSVVGDPSLAGDYVITADELEADLRYLSENGWTAVTCDELVRFADGEGDLPERPVVLSFDDGCYNNFYYALPLLEKYNMKAVFAPVTSWTEQAASEEAPSPVYSYMDADNLKTCFLSGRVELADHTYSLHDLSRRRGVLRKPGESATEYRRMLWSDLDRSRRIIGAVTGQPPITFVYPYGFCSDETEELVSELGYRVTFGCEERVNVVSAGDYGCLSQLGRFNRATKRTAEQIVGK